MSTENLDIKKVESSLNRLIMSESEVNREITENKKKLDTYDIMKFLMEFKTGVAEDIVKANEDVKEEIKKANKENVEALEIRMMENINTVRNDNEENMAKQTSINERLENRLTRIEEQLKRTNYQRMKQNELRQLAPKVDIQPMGSDGDSRPNKTSSQRRIQSQQVVMDTPEPVTRKESPIQPFTPIPDTPAGDRFNMTKLNPSLPSQKSDWAKSLDDENRKEADKSTIPASGEQSINYTNYKQIVTGALKQTKEGAKRKLSIEKEKTIEKPDDIFLPLPSGPRLIPEPIAIWFGNEPDILQSQSSSEEEEHEQESWDGKVARVQRYKRKKKKAAKRKSDMMTSTSTKAMHIVGVSPVPLESIEFYRHSSKTFAEAKKKTAVEFLQHYLKYDNDKISEIKIMETQISGKGDDTLYLSLNDISQVREIHIRMAEVKNDDVQIRNFILPQFHSRYMALNVACSEYRGLYKDKKTQLRFGQHDIEIWVKSRGAEEPFAKVKIAEIMNEKEIPGFDFEKQWKAKIDSPQSKSYYL